MDRRELEVKNRSITQKYLDMVEAMSGEDCDGYASEVCEKDFVMYHVEGNGRELPDKWAEAVNPGGLPKRQEMLTCLMGMHAISAGIAWLLYCDGKKINIYIGTENEYEGTLRPLVYGAYSSVQIEQMKRENQEKMYLLYELLEQSNEGLKYGGLVKGNPGVQEAGEFGAIDAVIRGMSGRKWAMLVCAEPVHKSKTVRFLRNLLSEATSCSILNQVSFSQSDNNEDMSYQMVCHEGREYQKKIEELAKETEEELRFGGWKVSVSYAAATPENALTLGGLLAAAFYGESSLPEPLHVLRPQRGRFSLQEGILEGREISYGGNSYPLYATYLSSRQLALWCAFPKRDVNGFSNYETVNFDVSRRESGEVLLGDILQGEKYAGNPYAFSVNTLNRHALIAGLTGSGKTNTVKTLICAIEASSSGRIPFLIIEPAKKEYYELFKLGFSDLQVYSVGSREKWARPYCMNPFERVGTTPLQTHIDYVFSAFKASFIMYTPMPYVLERAIYEIYEKYGWDIKTDKNTRGIDEYPTIEDLYYKIPEVVIQAGYDQKMQNDLIGSLQARINSLRLGAKGETLNVRSSFPIEQILNHKVIIELEDIGDDDVKAFLISMLLIQLSEYRRNQPDYQLETRHVLFIEEAHRLLRNVSAGTGENADPRGNAVEFFCNMLAELRSKGQSFVVADQIPSKLAPDLIKNTNLKIVHRTVAEEDRNLVGGSMHMTEEQKEYLASLNQGVAAVYAEGDFRPKLVKMRYAGEHRNQIYDRWTREDILRRAGENCFHAEGRQEYQSLSGSCPVCVACKGYFCPRRPEDILRSVAGFETLVRDTDPANSKQNISSIVGKISAFLENNYRGREDLTSERGELRCCIFWCAMNRWRVSSRMKKELLRAFVAYIGER